MAGARYANAPSYNRNIAPIIATRCASCHYPGQVAPFALMTYDDVKKRGRQIVLVTQSRYMPPWKALSDCDFRDNRRLTDAQVAMIHQWVGAGMAEGKAADWPAPPKFTDGWLLGPPDLIVKTPKALHRYSDK